MIMTRLIGVDSVLMFFLHTSGCEVSVDVSGLAQWPISV